jgi:hypothetical protein
MAKISSEAKKWYAEKIQEYKKTIEGILKRERSILAVLGTDQSGAGYKRTVLADENLNLVSYYVLMSGLSSSLLGVKNEAFLNDARKACYKSIIYLEEVVSPLVDAPFSEYEERMAEVEDLDNEKRYRLLRKLGFAIQSVEDGYGDNTKWRWSFVELEARFAAVAKNMLNLKTFVAGMDPRVPGYEVRRAHMELVKRLLQQAADRYREKYELSTLRMDDFKQAISYLGALRRLHVVVGDSEEADLVKRKMDIWNTKMEQDVRRVEQKSREARLRRS